MLLAVDRLLPRLLADDLPATDRIVVEKSARRLSLYAGDTLIRSYTIQLGRVPVGHKEREGDHRTPEGDYIIDYRNPRSGFYKSLHVSYPDAHDRAHAAAGGFDPGDDIMIHGRKNGCGAFEFYYRHRDWTKGCVAVPNRDMEEIWRSVPVGTPISILP